MSVLLQKIVLGEIEGKNRAIHAYNDIVWKIRTGFLTLILGGWAIVLKGIVDAQSPDMERYRGLVSALLLFSLEFTFCAWYIDLSYVRAKFRVILALNALIDELAGGKELNTLSSLLKVVGSDYRGSSSVPVIAKPSGPSLPSIWCRSSLFSSPAFF